MAQWRCSAAISAFWLAATAGAAAIDHDNAASPPNIVIVVASGAGYSDFGCYGSEIQTPNIDRLARNGLRFAKFYTNGSDGPTRASLLTGQYPQRVGMGENAGHAHTTPFPGYLGYLDRRNNKTIAEVLQSAGYQTAMTGEWSLGGERGSVDKDGNLTPATGERPKRPTGRGFERFFGVIEPLGESGRYGTGESNPWLEGKTPTAIGSEQDPIALTSDRTIRFLEEMDKTNADRPFFLYVCYPLTPHQTATQHNGDADWKALRRRRYDKAVAENLVSSDWRLPEEAGEASAPPKEAIERHAARIARLDQGVGRLVKTLEDAGELRSTLLFLIANNGVSLERSHAERALSNSPFATETGKLTEGRIATSCIVHWPAAIPSGGRVTHQLAHVVDLLPTCIEVAGATGVAESLSYPVDGISLEEVLRGGASTESRRLFWDLEGEQAVIDGDWKYRRDRAGNELLFNLNADGTETVDLTSERAAETARLRSAHAAWAANANVLPLDAIRKAQWNRDGRSVAADQVTPEELLNLDVNQRGKLPPSELRKLFRREEVRYRAEDGTELALPYFLYVPPDANQSTLRPLLVWIPGKGPVESQYADMGFLNWIDDFLAFGDAEIQSHPFYMLVPAGVQHAIGSDGQLVGEAVAESAVSAPDYTIAMIEDALARRPIDPERVSAIGVSSGGSVCFSVAARRPDLFAAIAPLASPACRLSLAPTFKGIEFWAFHNTRDPGVSVDGIRELVTAINDAGGSAVLTELDGEGHNAWWGAFAYNVRDWLVAQKRGEESITPAEHVLQYGPVRESPSEWFFGQAAAAVEGYFGRDDWWAPLVVGGLGVVIGLSVWQERRRRLSKDQAS